MAESIGLLISYVTPLVLGILALLIPSAAERMRRKDTNKPPTVTQGQPVAFSTEELQEIRIRQLERTLIEHGIPIPDPLIKAP